MELESLLSDAKLTSLRNLLTKVKGLPGAIIEVGVYKGGTLEAIAKDCKGYDLKNEIIGYDTFSGLPEVTLGTDKRLKKGDFNNPHQEQMQKEFEKRGLSAKLIKGHFPNSARRGQICFAHLDVDTYKSTLLSIYYIVTNLVKGGILVIDDYEWPQTPGVKLAIDHFLKATDTDKNLQVAKLPSAKYQFAIEKL